MRSTATRAASTTALASSPAAAMRRSSAAASSPSSIRFTVCTGIVAQVGDDAAERRRDPGEARYHRAFEPDVLDQRAGMQRTATAERHGGESPRIVSALDRDQADGAGHAGVGDPDDGLGRLHHVEAERASDVRRDGALRRLDVEARKLAADRALGVDAAEHDMRIGEGRALVALSVAGGPGPRAGALGADLQQPAAIDRGDRAAAGTDGGDLDHRRADDEAEIDGALRGERGLAGRRPPRRRTRCRRGRR